MKNAHLWKALYTVIILGTLVLQPSAAYADSFGSCSDNFERIELRVVSVEIDGEDDPTHPAIGKEDFSISATDGSGLRARLADPITGEAQTIDFARVGQ